MQEMVRYFITFIDDYSRYGYMYLMKNNSESFEKFKEYKNEVENQLDKKIKTLRNDRGGEYLSIEFSTFLKECGIIPQLTPPGTPQWNDVPEKRNRILLDMIHSNDVPNRTIFILLGSCTPNSSSYTEYYSFKIRRENTT